MTFTLPRLQVTTLAIAGWLLWSVANAASVDETRPLAADGEVSINNVAGTVNVSAWDKNEVHVVGELEDEAVKLEIGGNASHLTLEVKQLRKNGEGGSADLVVHVP